MREIEFRGKDKWNDWCYGQLVKTIDDEYAIVIDAEQDGCGLSFMTDSYSIVKEILSANIQECTIRMERKFMRAIS